MIRKLVGALVVFSMACSSQPAGPAGPDVKLTQTSLVPDVLVHSATGLPVQYRLEIDNASEHDVRLVSVEIESFGRAGAYTMPLVRHTFDEVIRAKSRHAIDFQAWVQRLQIDSKGDTDSPVLLRGSALFQGSAGAMRRNFVARGQ